MSRQALSIVASSPRSLVVSLAVGPFRCALCSLHAPHSSSVQFEEWWDAFLPLWEKVTRASQHVVCGCDLSFAFSGADASPSVGGVVNTGKENTWCGWV